VTTPRPTDTDWPTAASWLASGTQTPDPTLVVAGMPLAIGAVTPSRYDLAPGAIRSRLSRLSVGAGLRMPTVHDAGDSLDPPDLDGPATTVILGGHNGVTSVALGARSDLPRWGLLTLDAHHDVRPYSPGPPGNGSPVRALVDAGLPGANVVQVGITPFSNSPAHEDWCEDQGIAWFGPDAVDDVPQLLADLAARCDHVYVDLDVDVLDRAFAPGCPGSRPGGITPRQLFAAAHAAGFHPKVRAIDIVEVDPDADVASITVDAAALCLLWAAAGVGSRPWTTRT
jgi:arginase family enzyme